MTNTIRKEKKRKNDSIGKLKKGFPIYKKNSHAIENNFLYRESFPIVVFKQKNKLNIHLTVQEREERENGNK